MTVRILTGDCRAVLPTLPADSVQCCVTSPPYWGLRSYLPADDANKPLEIGSEPTLQEWVDTMVAVFREVRRVLRPDGTLFLNLGDAYAGGGRGGQSDAITGTGRNESRTAAQVSAAQGLHSPSVEGGRVPRGLKAKDLMGQPWRVAFALQADGWWLRQEIIWHKPNPMPESARDRCTKAHEHVFLLSKSERYVWDFEAMQEQVGGGAHARRSTTGVGFGHGFDATPKKRVKAPDTGPGSHGNFHPEGREKGKYSDGASERMGRGAGWRERKAAAATAGVKNNASFDDALADMVDTRNPRSVWTIPTHPFKGAHFATFPPALAERCITAGCPPGSNVLDPFGGAGTVGMVADRMQRGAILIELDTRSVAMATDRITGDAPLFAEVAA